MVLGDPPFEETPYVLDVHSVPGSYGSQPESAITVGQYTWSSAGGAKTESALKQRKWATMFFLASEQHLVDWCRVLVYVLFVEYLFVP